MLGLTVAGQDESMVTQQLLLRTAALDYFPAFSIKQSFDVFLGIISVHLFQWSFECLLCISVEETAQHTC